MKLQIKSQVPPPWLPADCFGSVRRATRPALTLPSGHTVFSCGGRKSRPSLLRYPAVSLLGIPLPTRFSSITSATRHSVCPPLCWGERELQLPSQNHTCYPVDKPPQTTIQRQSRSHLGLPSFPGDPTRQDQRDIDKCALRGPSRTPANGGPSERIRVTPTPGTPPVAPPRDPSRGELPPPRLEQAQGPGLSGRHSWPKPGLMIAPQDAAVPPQGVLGMRSCSCDRARALGIGGCIPSSLPPAVHLEKPHVSSHPSPFVPSDAAMEAAFSKTRLKPIDLIPPDAGQWRIVRGDPGSSRPRTPRCTFQAIDDGDEPQSWNPRQRACLSTSGEAGSPDVSDARARNSSLGVRLPTAKSPPGCFSRSCPGHLRLHPVIPAAALCTPKKPHALTPYIANPVPASRQTLRWGQPRHPGRPSQHPITPLTQ